MIAAMDHDNTEIFPLTVRQIWASFYRRQDLCSGIARRLKRNRKLEDAVGVTGPSVLPFHTPYAVGYPGNPLEVAKESLQAGLEQPRDEKRIAIVNFIG